MRPAVEPEIETFSGTVAEVLQAGPYAYLRLRVAADDERWVVVQGRAGPKDRITVRSFGRRRDFASRRLGRTFDELHFASIAEDQPGTSP